MQLSKSLVLLACMQKASSADTLSLAPSSGGNTEVASFTNSVAMDGNTLYWTYTNVITSADAMADVRSTVLIYSGADRVWWGLQWCSSLDA